MSNNSIGPQTTATAAVANATTADWADTETLQVVRPEVRRLLESAPGFARLADGEKRDVASKMVKVAAYMANPDGMAKEVINQGDGPIVEAQAKSGADKTRDRLSQAPGQVGQDFQAGAVREGVEQFGELIQKVDFPAFVSGLIKGVFESIVDSSIEQMRAYGELLANVAKAVDDFARDNISENNGRDWLAGKFPEELGVDVEQSGFGFADGDGTEPAPQPKLKTTSDDPEATLKKISTELGLEKPVTDLEDPAEEQRLVLAARHQMARGRQQLLASMVMLGINRIVVTDGSIRAKVVFDMRARDTAKREAKASMYDRQSSSNVNQTAAHIGGWGFGAATRNVNRQAHVATVGSAVDDTSESKAEVKANLSGEVRVNFKSDYLPMEKMASPQMISAIQGNAEPADQIVEGA